MNTLYKHIIYVLQKQFVCL